MAGVLTKSYTFAGGKAYSAEVNANFDQLVAEANLQLASDVVEFGGSDTAFVLDTTIPTGSTYDTLSPDTGVWSVDSTSIPSGTYKLEANLKVENAAATATLNLINLTDAATTAMVTATSASTTGARVQSGAITFAASGSTKVYGVKLITSNASYGAAAWDISIVRTA